MQKKAFFVHIPKTAGNTVRKILRRSNINLLSNPGFEKSERTHHFGIKSAKRVIGSHLSFTTDAFDCYVEKDAYKNSHCSFTIIRNPFDLLVSYYSHFIDSSSKKNWIDRGWANVNGYHNFKNFESFIDGYCNIDPEEWHVPELSKNLFGQIFDESCNSCVNYAIYFEDLHKGIKNFICDKLDYQGKKINMVHTKFNVSKNRKNRDYKEFYNEKMKKMIDLKCEWELDTFGYSYKTNKKEEINSYISIDCIKNKK